MRDQRATVYLNGQVAYDGEFEGDVVKVVGLRYRFHGPGAVDYVFLKDKRTKIVFAEYFGTTQP